MSSSSQLAQAVLHTLAYADVFDYPLTLREIHRYLAGVKASHEEVERALDGAKLFLKAGEYFTLRDREEIVESRKRRAEVANRLWVKAVRYGRIIASLPFVRMVAVTGSLAMNNTDEGNDVDYMIVTAPKHLWTCRALSLLVMRLARLERVSLCPNYLLTENALVLTDRSLYTAHELVQMTPISGVKIYEEMRRLNQWIYEYLPNAQGAPEPFVALEEASRSQPLLEFVFKTFPFQWFESWETNRKIKKLSREQSSSTESRFSKDVCKGHADRHGERVERAVVSKLKDLQVNLLVYRNDSNFT